MPTIRNDTSDGPSSPAVTALRSALSEREREVNSCRVRIGQLEALIAEKTRVLELIGPGTSAPSLSEAVSRLAAENDQLREEFRDLLDEAPIPYVHEGLDSRFIRANRAALNVLGVEPDEVAGTLGTSLVADTPETQQRLREAFDRAKQGKETGEIMLELRRKDNGKPVWVQWWSRPAPGGAYTRTMMVDITDRVRMEQTKAALEFTLESGQLGDWDLDLVRDTFRRSPRHDQCFGYHQTVPESVWGVQTFLAHVHPTDRARVESSFREAIDGLTDWISEFRIVWPDSSVHWIAARGSIYRTVEGKATRMLGIVMNITERKRSEEILHETKAVLEFTLKAAQVGDWDLDLINDTSRRSLRHDECFGYSSPIPEAAWGIEVFIRHVHPDDRTRVEQSLRTAATDLVDWNSEFRVIWPDESLHWIAARGSIYRTVEGKATRMLGVVMDITDRKQGEVALSASEQLARGHVAALKSTLDALAMETAPERLVDHILRKMTEQFGAGSSSVWRRDAASGEIVFDFAFEDGKVVSNADSRFAGKDLVLPMDDRWPWPHDFRQNHPSLIEDIRKVVPFPLRDRLVSLGIVTVLLIPMSIAGSLQGAIGLRFAEKRSFRTEEKELAQALANQAMLAMQLTRLSVESRESAVVAERVRMARDIHDTLAQGFTGVIVQLEAAKDARRRFLNVEADEHVNRACEVARDSLQEARRSVLALRPQVLETQDWCKALETMFTKMTANAKLRARIHVYGLQTPLPAKWDENLLRIGQEVLTNALRHSDASAFEATVNFAADQIRLDLHDNGCGFDVGRKRDGFGLIGIRERVEAMGGRLDVQSTLGMGTHIVACLPLRQSLEHFS